MTQTDLFAITPLEPDFKKTTYCICTGLDYGVEYKDGKCTKCGGSGIVAIKRARKSDPASSHIAAAEIEETAESQCARILAEVVKHPGCTTQELAAISGWSVHTLGRRLPELRKKNRVFNPWFGKGIDAMQLRRCAIRNRLALCWSPSVLP